MRNEPRKSEQDCMRIVLDNDGELDKGNKHFLLVPQYKLNSYPDELSCVENHERHWKQGDWIIHFPVRLFPFILKIFTDDQGCLGFYEGYQGSLWRFTTEILSSHHILISYSQELLYKCIEYL
jgi:hypothetical protein